MSRTVRLTRRGLVAALVGAGVTPVAFAAPAIAFPLRIGYARIGPEGFIHLRSKEQQAWTAMQSRVGALIETIEPIQPASMLGPNAPGVDGGASCALVARQIASNAGYTHVILYATQDGRKTYEHNNNWFAQAFASFRSNYLKYDRATGEAHLLDVAGGPAIASVAADAGPRNPLNLFDNRRNPEAETLGELTATMERRLQSLAAAGYEATRSIAD